jgi:dTDP-4-amino-4,6-dideoxygalactose transaminase
VNYDILEKFEDVLSDYTGAPYVVLTDSCTHALELCFRYNQFEKVYCPSNTYLSVPMMLHKLDIKFKFENTEWFYEVNFKGTNIWDSARGLDIGMYKPNQLQCLSFGHTKRLEIGHGGAILTDSESMYFKLKKAAYDGRDLNIVPWQNQKEFNLGFHYNMRLEDAAKGIEMLANGQLKPLDTQKVRYPDCSVLKITKL